MIGQNDFVEYWSSFQLFVENKNFYDPALLAPIQNELGFHQQQPLMMWLPPWALLLFAPLLLFGFATSSTLWLVLNVMLLGVCALSCERLLQFNRKDRFYFLLLTASFVPCVFTMYLGQVSLILAAAALLFLNLERSRAWPWAALCLLFLSLKPHLFAIFGSIWALRLLRLNAVALLTWTLALGLLVLLLTSLVAPDSLRFWLESSTSATEGAPDKFSWITPTIVGVTRLVLAREEFTPLLPMVLIPGLALLAIATFYVRRTPAITAERDAPMLLALSFCFAPFAWIFDATLLLPAYLAFFAYLFQQYPSRKVFVVSIALVLQAGVLLLHGTLLRSHHSFFWFPLLLLTLEFWRFSRSKETAEAAAS